MHKRGRFIVIDGGEGAGKSAVMQCVLDLLGDKAVRTREPGGSVLAERIRALILDDASKDADAETMFALFWAARRDHVIRLVRPTIERGTHVVCDRFDSSTWAYQIRAEKQAHLIPLFQAKRQYFLKDIRCLPDHYIILDGDPRILLPRAKRRAQVGEQATHFDNRELAYHDDVRAGFRDFVSDKPHTIIDAEAPEDVVRQAVVATVQALVA